MAILPVGTATVAATAVVAAGAAVVAAAVVATGAAVVAAAVGAAVGVAVAAQAVNASAATNTMLTTRSKFFFILQSPDYVKTIYFSKFKTDDIQIMFTFLVSYSFPNKKGHPQRANLFIYR
jgi:hypothetical protein